MDLSSRLLAVPCIHWVLTADFVAAFRGLGRMADGSLLGLSIATLASILPASQLAVQVVNYVAARLLPKMNFEKEDIPDRHHP